MESNQLYAGGQPFFPKSSANETKALDAYGITGSQETTVQRLLDELADRIANRLLEKTDIADWARQDSKPNYTAEEVHADEAGSARDALMKAKEYTDGAYQQAAAYTDHEIARLVNGADDTLDTLGEIADAIKDNESVVEALHNAIGAKASELELQAHMSNGTAHITQSERNGWNAAASKLSGVADGADTVSFRQALTSGTKIGTIIISGKSFDLYAPENTDTTYSDMKGATADAAGAQGLVPAPAKGTANRYLRSDGAWHVPPDNNTTYGNMLAATANAPGRSGLVPAPAAGKHNAFLRGDGTWVETVKTLLATNAGLPLDAIVGKMLDDKISGLMQSISEINSNLYVLDFNHMVDLASYLVVGVNKSYIPPKPGIISVSFYTETGSNAAIAITRHGLTSYLTASVTADVKNVSADYIVDSTAVTLRKHSNDITLRHIKYIPFKF